MWSCSGFEGDFVAEGFELADVIVHLAALADPPHALTPREREVRSALGGGFGEAGQAPAGADGIAHLLPALAVTVKVAVGEHHPGARGFLGAEGDLDLAGLWPGRAQAASAG